MTSQTPTRTDRRRERTRSALVAAGQTLLGQGRTDVPVLEIIRLADVGLGSFYNHFASKEALFDAAVEDALERHGALLDTLTADLDDPAVVFAQSLRLTGRLHRTAPELSLVLVHRGFDVVPTERGLGPRALRDIKAGMDSGRFHVSDPHVALAAVAGAVLALGSLLHAEPDRDAEAAADNLAEGILRMLGIATDEAADICRTPLPDLAVGVDA